MTLSSNLREALAQAGQEHVLIRYDALPVDQRSDLRRELEALDLELLQQLRGLACADGTRASGSLEPAAVFPLAGARTPEQQEDAARASARGEQLLREGAVGYVLVAGGQASRLGYDAPKGDYPIGPVTGRTLFAYHAQRLAAARARWGTRTPWYVMTSPANDAATRTIFADNNHFGLDSADIFFFSQDMLPALDHDGRVLFSETGRLFLAPNGHGGCLLGLASSGAVADMRKRGIQHLSYFQVDNPLVRPADSLFIGLHDLEGAGMSTKIVRKRDASEKVGVIGRVDGATGCIEYSDLPADLREARDAAGQLRFGAGNIAVHMLAVEFLEDLTEGDLTLPWHVAAKTMQAVGSGGEVEPTPGFKFETFVFDALAQSEKSVTLEVDRALEFSPVKNRDGEDSPATTRAALCQLFASWIEAAGGSTPTADNAGNSPVEVDPRFAETQDEFLARNDATPDVLDSGHVYRFDA